nr:hypothetical protein CFP56_09499 [Quercus suber]
MTAKCWTALNEGDGTSAVAKNEGWCCKVQKGSVVVVVVVVGEEVVAFRPSRRSEREREAAGLQARQRWRKREAHFISGVPVRAQVQGCTRPIKGSG